jgi:hypothetical protein
MSNQISVIRLSRDDFFHKSELKTKEDGTKNGIWVFINGTQNSWSLNHKYYSDEHTFKITKINDNAVVYDYIGRRTTPRDIMNRALELSKNRGHFNLDHEDSGFFIPEESYSNVSTNIYDTGKGIKSLSR